MFFHIAVAATFADEFIDAANFAAR